MSPYRKTSDLPATLALFPLPGALVFPRWDLPLNIFEPRYLNMIDDAMAGSRLIGMIQSVGGSRAHPDLARVGCAARITRYSETEDGRYLITLTGICRFAVRKELGAISPYRQVTPDWSPFAEDLHEAAQTCRTGRISSAPCAVTPPSKACRRTGPPSRTLPWKPSSMRSPPAARLTRKRNRPSSKPKHSPHVPAP